MRRFRSLLAMILGLALAGSLAAQDEVRMGAHQFSNGVHPTFDAVFEDPDGREVARFWQSELKGISMKVHNRKELVGEVARIPTASADTMRIFVALERQKGRGSYTTAHIAFLTVNGYVGPDSDAREQNGCMQWVQQRALALRRQLAQDAVEAGERQLANLERQLDMLKREEQRAQHNIRRAGQRIEEAGRTKAEAEEQLGRLQVGADTTGLDSSALTALEKDRRKQERMWQDRAQRSAYTRQGLEKKMQDLQWELTKNGREQTAKQVEIQRQQALVEELREKLRTVH